MATSSFIFRRGPTFSRCRLARLAASRDPNARIIMSGGFDFPLLFFFVQCRSSGVSNATSRQKRIAREKAQPKCPLCGHNYASLDHMVWQCHARYNYNLVSWNLPSKPQCPLANRLCWPLGNDADSDRALVCLFCQTRKTCLRHRWVAPNWFDSFVYKWSPCRNFVLNTGGHPCRRRWLSSKKTTTTTFPVKVSKPSKLQKRSKNIHRWVSSMDDLSRQTLKWRVVEPTHKQQAPKRAERQLVEGSSEPPAVLSHHGEGAALGGFLCLWTLSPSFFLFFDAKFLQGHLRSFKFLHVWPTFLGCVGLVGPARNHLQILVFMIFSLRARKPQTPEKKKDLC